MYWLLVLDLVANGIALAFTSVSVLLVLRAATLPVCHDDDDAFEQGFGRQSRCMNRAAVAAAVALPLLAVGQVAV